MSLVLGGLVQGWKLQDPNVAFAGSTKAALPFLRVSTLGLLSLLLANLLFALNIFVMIACVEIVRGPNRVRRRDSTIGKIGGESMKNGFIIFLAAFAVLLTSWGVFVLKPQLQLGGAGQVAVLNSSDIYPINRPGEANQGLQVYRANGCAACHTEQVQQDGVVCDVVLTSAGKNPLAVSNLIATLKLTGLTEEEAENAAGKITAAGGKVGDAHHSHRPGHRARLGLASQRRGRFSLR